jgi:hypothetical protein
MNDTELMQLDREVAKAGGLDVSEYYAWAHVVNSEFKRLPKYSTDLRDAITLAGEHYFVLHQNPQLEDPERLWECQIGLNTKFGTGSTPALAICRAYLNMKADYNAKVLPSHNLITS